jgi:hypothetical protein
MHKNRGKLPQETLTVPLSRRHSKRRSQRRSPRPRQASICPRASPSGGRYDGFCGQQGLIFGGSPLPGLTKDIIRRMIENRLQENAFGGSDRETLKLSRSMVLGER